MRKSKLLFLFILALFSTALFNSCKKESSDAVSPQTTVSETLIAKIKSWLDEQKTGLPGTPAAKIESLKLNLSYGETRLEKYKESKELIVIPVLSGFISGNNSGKDPANFLVLVFENQDSITRGNIIQYISSSKQKTAPINTFSKIFTYRNLDCSGQFTVLGITDYFQYELKFENGKLKSFAEQRQKPHPNNVSGRVSECIDWYWQTWFVWADGSMTLESEVYAFTTCDGDCWQPRVAQGRSLRVNCNSGGGGGNPIEYVVAVTRPLKWEIAIHPNNYWQAMSLEEVSGIKVASEPQGGHFTSITHQSSFLEYGVTFSWQELGNTVSLDNPRLAYASTTGKVIYNPNGYFETKTKSIQKHFAELF